MPHLTITAGGTHERPDGTKIPVSPQSVLQQRGPVVQAVINPAEEIAKKLAEQGESLPDPQAGLALIDGFFRALTLKIHQFHEELNAVAMVLWMRDKLVFCDEVGHTSAPDYPFSSGVAC